MTWPLRPLYGDVWCLTCEHVHIPVMPAVTFRCSDCGYGGWIVQVAESHATEYQDHIVHTVHHQTVPLPPLPRVAAIEDSGVFGVPPGWSSVVGAESGGWVLAGWTDAGVFHQYVPTEQIVRVCVDAIQEAYSHDR